MSVETNNANEGIFGDKSDVQMNEDDSAESSGGDVAIPELEAQPLSNHRHDDTANRITTVLNQNPESGASKGIEDSELRELSNMITASSATMALLAATYSSSDSVKDGTNVKNITCITLDDDSPGVSKPSSSKVSTRFNGELPKDYGSYGVPTKKYKFQPKKKDQNPIRKKPKRTTMREKMRIINQKKLEKREQLKLDAERRKELGLDDFFEKPVLSPQTETPRKTPQPICADESAGYVKAGYRLRNAKRPPNYEPHALQEWSAMREEERVERERQKLLEFKEEQIITELIRRKNSRAKKKKAKAVKDDKILATAENLLNEISQRNSDNNNSCNDDVKIVKVVPKPKTTSKSKASASSLAPKVPYYSEVGRKRKISQVILPISPFPPPPPRPTKPIACLPASSFRRPQLHTISSYSPRPPVIRFIAPVKKVPVRPQSKDSQFTDDCFTFVPCSTSSKSSSATNTTVSSAAPICSTTSKRVQLKKQAAYLNSLVDEPEPVFDECFSAVPCSAPSSSTAAKPPIFRQQLNVSKRPTILTSTTQPTTVSYQVASSVTNDCFTSVPCSPSVINANTVQIVPQNSMVTVPPLSNQPTLIPQLSTVVTTSANASTAAPLQMSQQNVQTITIPSSMLPPPGTPLQIIFVLPNASTNNGNNSNSTSPIIIQQPSLSSSSPPNDDIKDVKIKCELKD